MLLASYISRPLNFHRPAGTSRGVLNQKACWYVRLKDETGAFGMGEVSFIPGLSVEDPGELEIQLDHLCKLISRAEMDPDQKLPSLPGIRFAMETALMDLEKGGNRVLYTSDFTKGLAGIPINGLIWMGDPAYMKQQVNEKIVAGFRVLKLKVGALDFKDELEILGQIRSEFGPGDLEIRLDANGAWSPREAPHHLEALEKFRIHSIEQPIMPGQVEEMARLAETSPIPLALDEELIGTEGGSAGLKLLETIKPSYIILKPGLLGGFRITGEWIRMAQSLNIGWWVTSALESNLGLSAIAQWTYEQGVSNPQGLGTGQLFSNNIPSPLQMEGDQLWYRDAASWNILPEFNT